VSSKPPSFISLKGWHEPEDYVRPEERHSAESGAAQVPFRSPMDMESVRNRIQGPFIKEKKLEVGTKEKTAEMW